MGPAHHGDEADLIVGIVLKAASKLRGNGGRSRLLHPAQRHAHVLSLDHHRHAARGQDLLDGGGDLRGHMLLRLQPARVDVDETGKLGKSHHPVHRLKAICALPMNGIMWCSQCELKAISRTSTKSSYLPISLNVRSSTSTGHSR